MIERGNMSFIKNVLSLFSHREECAVFALSRVLLRYIELFRKMRGKNSPSVNVTSGMFG